MKTEYRIKPEVEIPSIFLQFKDINGVWRYIPDVTYAVVYNYLHQLDCPEYMPLYKSYYFKYELFGDEKNLILFTKQYRDIEKYFEYLRKLYSEHKKDQELKKEQKIIYL